MSYFVGTGYATPAGYICTNSNCPSAGYTKEFDVISEPDTGAKYLRYEDDIFCKDCGHEMDPQ